LLGVEVHREDTTRTRSYEEVGDQFGGDGDAGLIFTVLPGVTVERQNGGNAIGAGAADRIDHDEQLHVVMIGGRTGGLNDKNVFTPNIFLDFDEGFAVGERFDRGFPDFDADGSANGFAQRLVGCAAKNLHNLSVLSLKKGHRRVEEKRP
jgi:hypothetical protein